MQAACARGTFMNYEAIGERIRKYRKQLGFSQEKLAEQVDISVTHLSHTETGSTKLSLPVLVALAKCLNVKTDDLLCDTATDRKALENPIMEFFDTTADWELQILHDVLKATKVSLAKNKPN